MEKSYTEGDIENAMASPILLLSNLTKERRYQYRFRNISCLSVAAACLESSNRKLFASSVTLLSNFFSSANPNFPLPSDFQDPEYLVEMMKYHITNPKQIILQEIPFMGDLIGNMLFGINLSPDWPQVLHPNMLERATRRSFNGVKEDILTAGW